MTVLFLYLVGINIVYLSGHQLVSKLRSSERRIIVIVFADCRDAVWTITMLLFLCKILAVSVSNCHFNF